MHSAGSAKASGRGNGWVDRNIGITWNTTTNTPTQPTRAQAACTLVQGMGRSRAAPTRKATSATPASTAHASAISARRMPVTTGNAAVAERCDKARGSTASSSAKAPAS